MLLFFKFPEIPEILSNLIIEWSTHVSGPPYLTRMLKIVWERQG
jgi:hypothetical protein